MAPFDPQLLDALEASTVQRVGGTVWRQILLPTSVMRPNQRGGRWNPLGIETLYCSLDPETAAAEIGYLLASQSVPITRQRTDYAIAVSISKVVDLRPHPWGSQFNYDYDPTDVADCQSIGAAAAWLGLGALLVPSLRASGDNLIIFVANLDIDDVTEPVPPGYNFPPGPPPDHRGSPLTKVA